MDRKAAYEHTSKDIAKWTGQVQKNRQAEQLLLAEALVRARVKS